MNRRTPNTLVTPPSTSRTAAWPLSLVLGTLITWAGAACGTNPTGPADAGTRHEPQQQDPNGSSGTETSECQNENKDSAGLAAYVETVSGSVVGATDEPLASARAQLCVHVSTTGKLVCLQPALVAADGRFTVNVPSSARCMSQAVLRLVVPTADYTTLYCHVPLSSASSDQSGAAVAEIDVATPYRLRATRRATDLPELGDVQLERRVAFSDGLSLEVVPSALLSGSDAYTRLAAERVEPGSDELCFLAQSEARRAGLVSVYGFSPEITVKSPGISFSVPNTSHLPANSEVALHVLGGLGCKLSDGTALSEGEWANFGRGRVASDGRSIVGENLTCLTWLGYGPVDEL